MWTCMKFSVANMVRLLRCLLLAETGKDIKIRSTWDKKLTLLASSSDTIGCLRFCKAPRTVVFATLRTDFLQFTQSGCYSFSTINKQIGPVLRSIAWLTVQHNVPWIKAVVTKTWEFSLTPKWPIKTSICFSRCAYLIPSLNQTITVTIAVHLIGQVEKRN